MLQEECRCEETSPTLLYAGFWGLSALPPRHADKRTHFEQLTNSYSIFFTEQTGEDIHDAAPCDSHCVWSDFFFTLSHKIWSLGSAEVFRHLQGIRQPGRGTIKRCGHLEVFYGWHMVAASALTKVDNEKDMGKQPSIDMHRCEMMWWCTHQLRFRRTKQPMPKPYQAACLACISWRSSTTCAEKLIYVELNYMNICHILLVCCWLILRPSSGTKSFNFCPRPRESSTSKRMY